MSRTNRVWLLASLLAFAVVLTAILLILDAALSQRTGLRHQVWQLSQQTRVDGPLLVDEIAPRTTLSFLDGNPELPQRFFRAKWEGYWHLPERQQIEIHGAADDRLDVWINDTRVLRYRTPSAIHPVVHTTTLDGGVHSLRVEYEQHRGAASMRLQWAPLGEAPKAFNTRRLFREPPDAADRFLASAVIWLRHVVVPVWIVLIPTALLLLTRRSTGMSVPDQRTDSMICTLTPYDIALLAGLCAAMFVYGAGNLSLKETADDGTQNLTLGLRLVETGEYGLEGRDAFREPFVPSVWGVVNGARELLGFQRLSHDCVATGTPPCWSIYSYLKIVNVAFLVAGAAVAFLLVHRLTGSVWLGSGALLLTAQNGQLLVSVDRFYTEPHTATLVILTALLAFRMSHRRRVTDGLLLGLTLAALVLTKVVFVYLWIFIALAFVASDALSHRLDRSTAVLLSVFLASHFLLVGAWMVRNHAAVGSFVVAEGREAGVSRLREAYHGMRDDEFAAAFWYYLPVTRNHLDRLGISAASVERVHPSSPNSFRSQGRRNRGRTAADTRDALLSEPWQHLKISLLLAWRGVFLARGVSGPSAPDRDLGYSPQTGALRLADTWGLPLWPRWGIPFSPTLSTALHLVGFLSLLVAPAWFWLAHRRFDVVLMVLPALYCHAVYAAATHFIPRYADPETPLRSVATMLLVFLVVFAARRRRAFTFRRASRRTSPAAG